MKRIVLFVIASLIASVCSAQNAQKVPPSFTSPAFTFKMDGTFTTGTDDEFIVYQATGYKKAELYKAILVAIYRLYDRPDYVVSALENEVIVVNGISGWSINYASSVYSFSYTIRFIFKDGKIRIDTPLANAYIPDTGELRSNIAGWIKTQDNFIQVKPGFELGIKGEILKILVTAFPPNGDNW